MKIQENISLRDYSTMRLGGSATYLAEAHTQPELTELIDWATTKSLSFRVIGTGSNIVWRDEGFAGLVIINKIGGFEDFVEDDANHYLTIGAGENWDEAVARTVELGLTGIEALSLIPGTVGATPIQNVGAYGQDVSQTISSIAAYDTAERTFINLTNTDCTFGYRTSRFKHEVGRFVIVNVTFHLLKGSLAPPFYAGLEQYFTEHNIHEFSPQTVREAAIAIRRAKLPDWNTVANTGSFFANPIIGQAALELLQVDYPELPHWETETYGYVKVPAAWLIEQAGFKDFHDTETGIGTWPAQPLVLVNEHARSTSQLLSFRDTIIDAVKLKFGVTLEQEPELLP